MKRVSIVFAGILLCCGISSTASAQMGAGMNFFSKPNIADIFHPVVGKGATYETSDKDGAKSTLEMSVMGKEAVDGKTAYWLEVAHSGRDGKMTYAKMLVTPDDFEFHRMIFVMPSTGTPMEMPINKSMKMRENMQEKMNEWHNAGNESVTVPAGTFACEHWAKNDGKGDVWVSRTINPMSLVKSVEDGRTMLLTGLISDAKEHITGTPQKFDPQLMRQMAEAHKKPQ